MGPSFWPWPWSYRCWPKGQAVTGANPTIQSVTDNPRGKVTRETKTPDKQVRPMTENPLRSCQKFVKGIRGSRTRIDSNQRANPTSRVKVKLGRTSPIPRVSGTRPRCARPIPRVNRTGPGCVRPTPRENGTRPGCGKPAPMVRRVRPSLIPRVPIQT